MPYVQAVRCDECGEMAYQGKFILVSHDVLVRLDSTEQECAVDIRREKEKKLFCTPGCLFAMLNRVLVPAWNEFRGGSRGISLDEPKDKAKEGEGHEDRVDSREQEG